MMASNPGARKNDAQIIAELKEQVRLLRVGRRGHTESKTFIVGGAITTSLYIPPARVLVDADGDTPEFKRIIGFEGTLRVGSCTIDWYLNGSLILDNHEITTTDAEFDEDLTAAPYPLPARAKLRPVIVAATNAVDLDVAVIMATAPR